jgi:superfamily II RNA helicase
LRGQSSFLLIFRFFSFGLITLSAQINSANELILTELILDNTFASYEPEEVVALLSCFIFQEKTDVEPLLTPKLEEVRASSSSLYYRDQSLTFLVADRANRRSSKSRNEFLQFKRNTERTSRRKGSTEAESSSLD